MSVEPQRRELRTPPHNMLDAIYRGEVEGQAPNSPIIFARKLHERSFLLFEYQGSDGQVVRTHLPFLENININEQGKANLASYNLLGRAGQLFSYGGAESRKISIDFEINLLHLFHLQETEGITERFKRPIKNTDRGQELRRFTNPDKAFALDRAYQYSAHERSKFLNSITDNGDQLLNQEESRQRTNDRYGKRPLPDYFQFDTPDLDKTLDLVMYWINTIRSSTLNNSQNTVYGPPIVRLNHGPLYMNSPCIVEDYKISIDKQSNYEVETLLPYTIKVSMSLIESRAGNFGEYKEGRLIEGDNLTGWEAILDRNVLDSMNYNFEDFALPAVTKPITPNPGGTRFSGRPST